MRPGCSLEVSPLPDVIRPAEQTRALLQASVHLQCLEMFKANHEHTGTLRWMKIFLDSFFSLGELTGTGGGGGEPGAFLS